MKRFEVTITETFIKKVIIEAETVEEAENIVLSTYVSQGFLSDHNIGASYSKSYWFSDYESAKEYFDSIYNTTTEKFVVVFLFYLLQIYRLQRLVE